MSDERAMMNASVTNIIEEPDGRLDGATAVPVGFEEAGCLRSVSRDDLYGQTQTRRTKMAMRWNGRWWWEKRRRTGERWWDGRQATQLNWRAQPRQVNANRTAKVRRLTVVISGVGRRIAFQGHRRRRWGRVRVDRVAFGDIELHGLRVLQRMRALSI